MINGALGYARPAVLAGAVAWLAYQAICVANGVAPLRSFYHGLIRMAVVVFLLQAANYNQYIDQLALAIPTQASNALAAVGVAPGSVSGGAAFDTVWNAAYKAGWGVYEMIPKYSLSSIALWFGVMLYLGIAIVAIGAAWVVYIASTVLLTLLLAAGPLFVALYAFPQTIKFGVGWVAGVASTIVAQILTVAVLVMFVGIEQTTLAGVGAAAQAGTGNFIGSIVTLFEAAMLMGIVATLVRQCPGIAQGIAGGVYQNVSGILGTAEKAAAETAKGTIGGIALGGRGVSAVARAATAKVATVARISQPTGRSLSGG